MRLGAFHRGVSDLGATAAGAADAAGDARRAVDSGVRNGADVFKALALGATAVCLVRPYYGLALAGERGVREVIENVVAELDLTTGLSGLASVAEMGARPYGGLPAGCCRIRTQRQMTPLNPPSPAKIGQIALKLTRFSADEVSGVLEILDQLGPDQATDAPRTAAEICEIAKKRAALLRDVPRELVAARFTELAEEIRQKAIAKGTAIDGDG